MMEHGPDFEDDKIRLWQPKPEGGPTDDYKADPTILSIKSETEEIFESRAYHLRETPETYLLALRLALAEHDPSRPRANPEQVAERAAELVADAGFKFLAKRHEEDGLITDILLFHGQEWRYLVSRQDWVTEEEYRDFVARFEAEFLEGGLVSEPLVVTPEEWRRYMERQGPGKGEGE